MRSINARLNDIYNPTFRYVTDGFWNNTFDDKDLFKFSDLMGSVLQIKLAAEPVTKNEQDILITKNFSGEKDEISQIKRDSHEIFRYIYNDRTSIAPLTSEVEGKLNEFAWKVKGQYVASFHDILKDKACHLFKVQAENYLDNIAYACHMMDPNNMKKSYRDHFVHTVVVLAMGVHWLNKRINERSTLRENIQEKIEDHIQELTNYTLDEFSSAIQNAHCEIEDFVDLVWLITSLNHDHGRFLECLMQIQGINLSQGIDTLSGTYNIIPAFLSYPGGTCFKNKKNYSEEDGVAEEDPYICPHTFPAQESIKRFLDHIDKTCHKKLYKIIKDRIGVLSKINYTAIPSNDTEDKLYHDKEKLYNEEKIKERNHEKEKKDPFDHAIISAIELFILYEKINADTCNPIQIVFNSALQIAINAILYHHSGTVFSYGHEMLEYLNWDKNPFGVLLRLTDYYHDCGRIFLINRDRSSNNRGFKNENGVLKYSLIFDISHSSKKIMAIIRNSKFSEEKIELNIPIDLESLEIMFPKDTFKDKYKKYEITTEREEQIKKINDWLKDKSGIPFEVRISNG